MRNLKKFLALVLAMLMVLSMAVITGAADKEDEADYTIEASANYLAALGIMKGDGNSLNLDGDVTRYQAALFFVQATTGKTDTSVWNADKSAYFTDVPEYGTAIDYAYGTNLIVGRGNGIYGYNDKIIYQDILTMAVRALGYATDGMVYPQGYILAAQKLGLTDYVDPTVSFKDELTRGETAQIIWKMLNTDVAIIDPLSNEPIYPGIPGTTELWFDKDFSSKRVKLLVEAGFAADTIDTIATAFIAADDDKDDDYEVDTVKLAGGYEIAAADLDITAETKKTEYLGLPMTLYINCKEADFQDKYDDGDANVVFASVADYTVVENLGDAGKIKVVLNDNPDKTYVSLNGTKFQNSKYYVQLKTWNDTNGWQKASDQTWNNAFASFVYDNKEYVGNDVTLNPYAAFARTELDINSYFNTYAKVAYRVTDETVFVKNNELVAEGTDGAVEKIVVEALYTPYTFGQYNVFTLKDATTSKDADYATYTNGTAEITKLFGSDRTVTENTASVSKSAGAKAKIGTLTIEGKDIESGDFMIYDYNKADNVLTVAMNCGAYATGRLTGTSATKETVKIGGVSYKVGFDGLFAKYDITYTGSATAIDGYINKLEKGKNNVKYIEVDGKIVYLGTPDVDDTIATGAFDFVIATNNAAIMAELLEFDTVTEYTKALTAGVYIDEDDCAAIAVLNLTTGEWELASLESIALTYNAKNEKFTNAVDVAYYAQFQEIGQLNQTGAETKFNNAIAALDDGIFALISEDDGVYKLGVATTYGWAEPTVNDTVDGTVNGEKLYTGADDAKFVAAHANYTASIKATAPFAFAENATGILFSTKGRTNALEIPGTGEVVEDAHGVEKTVYETSRFDIGDDSVIVVLFADGNIGVRKGATKSTSNFDYTVNGTNNIIYAASENLIVIDVNKDAKLLAADMDKGTNILLEEWNNNNTVGSDLRYLATPATYVEEDKNDDGEIVYYVYDIYDLANDKFVDLEVEDVDISDLRVGETLFASKKNGKISYTGSNNGILYTKLDGVTADVLSRSTLHQVWQGAKVSSPNLRKEGTGLAGYFATGALVWTDAETITVGAWIDGYASSITAHGLVYNMTDLEEQDLYDFDRMILAELVAGDVVPKTVSYLSGDKSGLNEEYYDMLDYAQYGVELIDAGVDAVTGADLYYVSFPIAEDGYYKITEPTEGVFNDFMAKFAGSYLIVPEVGNDDYTDTSAIKAVKAETSLTYKGDTGLDKRITVTLVTSVFLTETGANVTTNIATDR